MSKDNATYAHDSRPRIEMKFAPALSKTLHVDWIRDGDVYVINTLPHLLVLATSERLLPTGGTFRVILASESH